MLMQHTESAESSLSPSCENIMDINGVVTPDNSQDWESSSSS